ncbi:MAG: glycosyltransferase family 2 protein [Pseudomonadales bacterium]|jgi:cellulose synthase/poly-beta-1,6-N-acetylglucosamine synthase-like glycosyltransferase|nr:glycosyltransferase family 2 protein [Pseudomonadales bacterium]
MLVYLDALLVTIQGILGLFLTVLGLYMLVLTVGAWRYRPRFPEGEGGELPRIGVLVPAHDEGAGIVGTVRDLLASDYPRDRFEVFVLADNCSDDTADHARRAGATVVERRVPELRGKAHALDWCLRERRETLGRFDLLSFVDADMHVDRGYLRASAAAFRDPATTVVQARYTMDNADDSFYAAMGFMSYAYVNHVRPAGRCHWGGSADLGGSGMTFRAPFILERGWASRSLAEDLHFGKLLHLEGVRIVYVPAAIVTSRIPPHREQVAVQQSRWEAGRNHTLGAVLRSTLRALVARPCWSHLDALLDLLTPSLSVVAALVGASFLLALVGFGSPLPVGIAVAGFGAAVLTGLIQLRAPARLYGRIAFAPLFVIWKLTLLVRIRLLGGPDSWDRTPRARDGGAVERR